MKFLCLVVSGKEDSKVESSEDSQVSFSNVESSSEDSQGESLHPDSPRSSEDSEHPSDQQFREPHSDDIVGNISQGEEERRALRARQRLAREERELEELAEYARRYEPPSLPKTLSYHSDEEVSDDSFMLKHYSAYRALYQHQEEQAAQGLPPPSQDPPQDYPLPEGVGTQPTEIYSCDPEF